eukprot:8403891-Pyramimonas_sp.AAC.1
MVRRKGLWGVESAPLPLLAQEDPFQGQKVPILGTVYSRSTDVLVDVQMISGVRTCKFPRGTPE